MTSRIKLTSNINELDQIFQIKHKIFVNNNYIKPQPNKHMIDHFNTFPNTINFTIFQQNKVISTLRFIKHNKNIKITTNKFFDFSEYLPKNTHHNNLSILYLKKEFRKQQHLFIKMININTY